MKTVSRNMVIEEGIDEDKIVKNNATNSSQIFSFSTFFQTIISSIFFFFLFYFGLIAIT